MRFGRSRNFRTLLGPCLMNKAGSVSGTYAKEFSNDRFYALQQIRQRRFHR